MRVHAQRQPCELRPEPATNIEDPLLPPPLTHYLSTSGADISWKPIGSGIEGRSLELPKAAGSIRLLRLNPGERLPEQGAGSEGEVALVLQGACRGSDAIYSRGDIIELGQDPLMGFGDAGCVCLIADEAARPAS